MATMRAQVKSVGRLKNIGRLCRSVVAGASGMGAKATRSAVEGARLELAILVEQEGFDKLPGLGQARDVAVRRGAADRLDRDLERVLGFARLAQDLDPAHAAVAVELDLEHRDREELIGDAAD